MRVVALLLAGSLAGNATRALAHLNRAMYNTINSAIISVIGQI